MKLSIRATQNKQRGRMQPAGRQFDMPGIVVEHSAHDQKVVGSIPIQC